MGYVVQLNEDSIHNSFQAQRTFPMVIAVRSVTFFSLSGKAYISSALGDCDESED